MKRLLVAAAAAALVLPASVAAQDLARVLAPLPERARDEASVVHWAADHSYSYVKEGSSTWVCYDRSGEPGRAPFDVQCTSKANLPRVAQNRRARAEAADRDAERAMLEAAEANGTRVLPEYGSMWIAMRGQDQASAGIHTTIAVPGATGASTGLPENGQQGGAYLMGAGTSTAHIMVPGR